MINLLGLIPFFFIGDCYITYRGEVVCGTPCPEGKTVFDMAKEKQEDKKPILKQIAEIVEKNIKGKKEGVLKATVKGFVGDIEFVGKVDVDQAAQEIMDKIKSVIPLYIADPHNYSHSDEWLKGYNHAVDETRQALVEKESI